MARVVYASTLIIMLGPPRGVEESFTACLLSHHCSAIVGVILRWLRWWSARKVPSGSM